MVSNKKKSRSTAKKVIVGFVKRPVSNIAKIRTILAPFNITLGAAGIQSYGVVAGQLSNTVKYTDYCAVYDEYRITRMKVVFVPNFVMSVNSTGFLPSGNFACCADLDDNVIPTSYSDVLNHSHIYYGSWLKQYEITFSPKVLLATDNNSTTNVGLAPKPMQWLDSSVTTVQHYGVKWTLDPGTSGVVANQSLYEVFIELDVEYRNQT